MIRSEAGVVTVFSDDKWNHVWKIIDNGRLSLMFVKLRAPNPDEVKNILTLEPPTSIGNLNLWTEQRSWYDIPHEILLEFTMRYLRKYE